MIRVGITGGIGAGKTTVSKYLESLGYPVFYSDLVSREILMNDKLLHQVLAKRWGDAIIQNNEIHRPAIAQIVFNNKEELKFLNSVLHPLVGESFKQFCSSTENEIVFKEAAIMFESGAYKTLDYILNVHCDEEIRIKRVMQRDNATKEEVLSRLANQWTDEQRKEASDFTVVNDGVADYKQQLKLILKTLNGKSKDSKH